MGYYTDFSLEVEGEPSQPKCPSCGQLCDWNWEEKITDFVTQAYNAGNYDPFDGPCKWYDAKEHMLSFSALYPNHLFILDGVGEDPDDRWRAYFKNGLTHQDSMIMSFPDFDPTTLE